MLDPNALNQLAQLKDNIIANTEYATGKVVDSTGRFGFVRMTDGGDAFLSPEKMQRVIPGDTVKIVVKRLEDGKIEGELESLVEPAIDVFVGEYKIKGKAHFVAYAGPKSSRWLFLPPKFRSRCQDGDIVLAKLIQHPFRDGKSSAKILEKIGQPKEPKFEFKFVKAKYQLAPVEPKDIGAATEVIEKQFVHEAFGDDREDLSTHPFVTIDAASTKDMDDALYAEPHPEQPEQLRVYAAIADPGSFIQEGSALAKLAKSRGTSHYLLGGGLPMLPVQLSHHCFSLEEGKLRPALVCIIDSSATGEILNFRFARALVRSHAKLNYEDVGAWLKGDDSQAPDETLQLSLKALQSFATARRAFRESHLLSTPDQGDFEYHLNERGHIESVSRREKTAAHYLVEETMVAVNHCAGELCQTLGAGLQITHHGFRAERLGEVKALLREEKIEHDDLETLEGFVQLIKRLEADDQKSTLLGPLRRMMSGADINRESGPHFGMGLNAYATVTSPIRRYADLINHWMILQSLAEKPTKTRTAEEIEALNVLVKNGRQADRELTQWLLALYAQSREGEIANGTVRIVTQTGFGVRLHDSGIEGFIAFGKKVNKQFDAKRMTLAVGDQRFAIGDEVRIKIAKADIEKRRVSFELASENSAPEHSKTENQAQS